MNYFKFYKVQKNEDSDPYLFINEANGEGIVAVADGLGGSGSFVHVIEENDKKGNFEKTLKESFLPEYYLKEEVPTEEKEEKVVEKAPENADNASEQAENAEEKGEEQAEEIPVVEEKVTVEEAPKGDEEFEKWVDQMLAPMLDDESDTSALWGSRIAIARTIYYLKSNPNKALSDEETRKEMVEFVYKGLNDVKDTFHLKTGNIAGQSTLPTTLVVMKYKEMEEGVKVEVVWAGDSRGYALIPGKGLKQLTEDDEDGSGAINNLFSIHKEKNANTVLHYKEVLLPKKSAIFACSDGFFDPFDPIDNIGVECVLLDAINKENSYEEFEEEWHAFYKPTTHDDCSISFVSLGYQSYEAFKDDFCDAERMIKVRGLFDDYSKYRKLFLIFDGIEDRPEEYIEERAMARKDSILDIISQAIVSGQEDGVITDKEIAIYEKLKKDKKEEAESKKGEAIYKKRAEILNDINDNIQDCSNIFDVFNLDQGDDVLLAINEANGTYKAFEQANKELEAVNTQLADLEKDQKQVEARGDAIINSKSKKNADGKIIFSLNDRLQELEKYIAEYKQRENENNDITHRKPINCGPDDHYLENARKTSHEARSQYKKWEKAKENLEKVKQDWIDKKPTCNNFFGKIFKLFCGLMNQFFDRKLFEIDREIIEPIKKALEEYHQIGGKIEAIKKEIEKKDKEKEKICAEWQKNMSSLNKDLPKMIENCDHYFTKEAIVKYDLPVNCPQPQEITAEDLKIALDDEYAGIIENYKKCNQSLIDRVFNRSKVELFRSYKDLDENEARKAKKEIAEMEKNYFVID
ncbi:MAG: hypothetical protein IKB56_07125 [Clostridia bacterium]|nr:hypothetical protein [Clostridia bacterium]